MAHHALRNCLFIIILVSVAATAPVSIADDAAKKEMSKKIEEAAEAIKNYSAAQKDEAIKNARATMDDLDINIKQLEDRLDKDWNKMDQVARQAARATLRNLRKQRTELAEWYGELKQSSAAAWEQVKKGFVSSYDVLRESVSKAQKDFRSE